MDTRRPPLPALTGLRFFAALLVVGDHYWGPTLAGVPGGPAVAGSGYLGVSLFFLLSGFILAYTYVHPSGQLRGTPAHFWRARFARIYPTYLFALLLALVTAPQGALRSLFLLQAWTPDVANDPNPPGWSLSAELLFYLLFPVCVRLLAHTQPRLLLGVGLICWVLLLSLSALYLAVHPDRGLWDSVWMQQVTFNPLSRLPEFVLGIVLGRLWCLGRVPRWLVLPAPAAGLLVVAALLVSPDLPYALTNHGLFDPLFALLIVALAGAHGPLARPCMVRLGEASYALYLLQMPVWGLLCAYVHITIGDGKRVPALVICFTLVLIGCSLITYRYLETPARRWLRGDRANRPLEPARRERGAPPDTVPGISG